MDSGRCWRSWWSVSAPRRCLWSGASSAAECVQASLRVDDLEGPGHEVHQAARPTTGDPLEDRLETRDQDHHGGHPQLEVARVAPGLGREDAGQEVTAPLHLAPGSSLEVGYLQQEADPGQQQVALLVDGTGELVHRSEHRLAERFAGRTRRDQRGQDRVVAVPEDDVFLARKVVEEGARRDLHGGGDLLDGGRVVTLLEEEAGGLPLDGLPRPQLLPFPESELGHASPTVSRDASAVFTARALAGIKTPTSTARATDITAVTSSTSDIPLE